MPKFYLNLIFFFVANSIFANTLDAYITINRFFQLDTKQHYIEVSYMIPSNFVSFIETADNKYQAQLKVDITVNKGDKIISNKKYILQTEKYNSIEEVKNNLKDVIRLFAPSEDTLNIKIDIEDLNNTNSNYSTNTDIVIPKDKPVFLSDLMLINTAKETKKISAFNRNNLLVMPKLLYYYPTEINNLQFYCEFYQLEAKKNYLVSYLLTNEEGIYVNGYASFKKIENKSYDVIISGFDISKLPSGNYYVFMELKDDKNNTIEIKRSFFQRNNKSKDVVKNIHIQKNELEVITNNFAKKYNLENIRHHCLALAAISNTFEKATIQSFKDSKDIELMQNYFFSFWIERNPKDPEAEWMAYAKKLQFVENNFTTLSNRGFETSRGMVYLIHGPPDDIKLHRKKVEFWLWNYEKLKGQGNVYFVFVNKDRITGDFVLEHTTLKAELHNKKWADYIKNEL